ncbi:uncharacterized protein LOC129597231 isoform X2 [Paramacrobiotus metropolitanus]|uniref:uncharacterized protein LOC129597231 isoform X2 n=1 Tax=Paramacrobiotus metropolitanus TaxID=2943436 RepID=UPI002445FBA7|nr:uncharacterized protein LOC129597231 isoform X2 [Paramacrobiotus metropolitanus]
MSNVNEPAAASSSECSDPPIFPQQRRPVIRCHPVRAVKYECRQRDEKLLQELTSQLDAGLLYLDPYLKLRLGSHNSYVDAVLRTILCSIPLVQSDTTVALQQQRLYLLDKNGKRLSMLRKVLYLILAVYLPALRGWIRRFWPTVWQLCCTPLVQTLVSGASLLNFLGFMATGAYPTLADRIAGVSILQPVSKHSSCLPTPRHIRWELYGVAFISALRVLRWRQLLLILRCVLRSCLPPTWARRMGPEVPAGNCPVCRLSVNYPCRMQCGHSVCYYCMEVSCPQQIYDLLPFTEDVLVFLPVLCQVYTF